ncbi:hypothetical protein EUA52_12290 [Staphylococcus saprophyticus]|uniref:hypothetical protein n=1 Tax=Staphylococcus saprophyticus TaxID=29385 RepID=UPI00065941A0|nr:hypothetical protein [Staphylococcus saprophyticus]RXS11737.1 hypothetical protein EUA52_12290 [Staphylococcus saprophyticus]CRV31583.1 Uncharacterised protein [Streptococcus equi subsp. equi]
MAKIHLDTKEFTSKPLDSQTLSNLHKRICKTVEEIAPKELAKSLANGQTMVLGVMRNEVRKKVNLNYQEVIALDFDDNTTIEEIESNEFIKQNASFIYTTFSHTEGHHKFRVVFFLENKLTNNAQVLEVYNKLFEMFPTADISCKDSSRLFFGGKSYIEINFNNRFNVNTIVELPEGSPIQERQEQLELAVDNTKVEDVNIKPTWWLIRHGYDDLVKTRLSRYKATTHHQATAMEYVKSLNMGEVLDLPTERNFNDLFTQDTNPSANVYKLDDSEVWLYTRHSSDESKRFTGSLIQVVQKLKKTHFMGALMYLIEVMDIDFKATKEIQRLINEIEIYSALLLSSDLKNTYPHVAKIFKDGRTNYASDVVQILQIAKNNVVEVDGEIRMISQLSSRELAERIHGTQNKKKRIQTVLNLMSTTDWIDKLSTDDLPEALKAKLVEYQKANNRKYRKNVIEFKYLGSDFFGVLNNKCEVMLDKGFTARATLTKEGLQNTFGDSEANKVFNQDTDRKVSKLSNDVETEAVHFIMEMITTNGYVEEKAVIEHLSNFIGKSLSDYKFKQLRSKITEGYGLERVRLNKTLKKEFAVSDKYTQTQSPSIFKKLG